MGERQTRQIDYFERQTTQRNDYRWPKVVKKQEYLFKEEREENIPKISPQYAYMDVEALVPYSPGVHIPFNLHWQKKPILQTNPKDHFKPLSKQDTSKDDENIRFTRPRVYKCPEISLDDIPDKDTRKMIIDYMYASTWETDNRDAAPKVTHRDVTTTTWQSPWDDEVRFKGESVVSPSEEEWGRNCCREWDKAQTFYTANPDKMFWNNKRRQEMIEKRPPFSMPNEYLDHIIKLRNEEKLRMPYNIPNLGYTGYIPKAPFNINPEKYIFRPTDGHLSLNEAVERWKSGKAC